MQTFSQEHSPFRIALVPPKSVLGYDTLVSMTISFCRYQIKEKYETQRRKWTETSDMLTGCKHHLFLCIIHCTCHASVDTRHSHIQAQDKIVKNMPTMSVTTFYSPWMVNKHKFSKGTSQQSDFEHPVNYTATQTQTVLYDILPSTTAVFSYAVGSWKLSANEKFFVGAQTVASL